ncbi:MAG: RNA polymerase sigma factor, partial [Pyrinomonadaceae bacterium]
MPKPRAISPSTSHEEVFAQRYRWLMGWALRLTNHDREQAEDLVHDTFVHFMITQTDLRTIESIEGYLYGMLRNLHVSQVRRALRLRETAFPIADILSISETASVQNELRMAGQKLQVQDELCRICQYASIRKHSSKVGSVVILRFFHGYYPNEIAAVTRSTRAGVDKMLQRARTEARLYLKDPESLSFLNQEQTPPELQIRFGQEPEDLLHELKDALYRSREGECLSVSELRDVYQTQEADHASPAILAHIVCCAACLDEVNRLLGLPLLAQREPEKMTGRDKRDKGDGGSGDGSGTTGDFMEKPRRRLKQVLEHRPKELRLSVNGFILGSHAINSELNKLSISAKGEEKIGFVEVLSEEEVRLLFCVVAPPPEGAVEQRVRANLSDRRSLELFLDFSDSWPALDVTYRDPTFTADANALSAESAIESGSPVLTRAEAGSDQVEGQGPTSKVEGSLVRNAGIRAEIRRRWSGLWTWNFGQLFRPGTVTAVVALLLIAALTFVYLRPERAPIISAANLLQQSAAAEEANTARTDQVLHRTINLEEKKVSGELIARRRIEVWQSAEKGITARRLYDERGQLVAGDWRRADGVQTLYHHGSQPKLQIRNPQSASRNFEDVWQLSPSAKEFSALIENPDNARLEESPFAYAISYERGSRSANGLVKATLSLSRADLHATDQTLFIQQDGELREYHFTEASFERHAPSTVAPSVFDPNPELVGNVILPPERINENGVATLTATIPATATAALEVEVVEALNNANAFTGEPIDV